MKQNFLKILTFSPVGNLGQVAYPPAWIYIYKSCNLCLFVYMIITQESLNRFASYFDLGTQQDHYNVLSLAYQFLVEYVDSSNYKIFFAAKLGSKAGFINKRFLNHWNNNTSGLHAISAQIDLKVNYYLSINIKQ